MLMLLLTILILTLILIIDRFFDDNIGGGTSGV